MRLFPVLSLLLVVALLPFGVPGGVHACSCEAFTGLEEHVVQRITEAESMVTGRIVSARPMTGNGVERYEVILAVEQEYKGDGARISRFETSADSASCGYEDVRLTGDLHFITLHTRQDGHLETGLCSSFPLSSVRTNSRHAAYLDALGRLAPPRTISSDANTTPTWILAAYVVGSFAAVAGLVALSRRLGRP